MGTCVRSVIRSTRFVVLVFSGLMMLPGMAFAQSASGPSGTNGDEPYIQFLVRRATDGKVPERALAMRKLGHIGFSTIVPVLEDGLSASDQRLRMAAVHGLANIPLPEASNLLRDALFAEDELVSTAAAEFLTERSAQEGIPPLIDGLSHDTERIRSQCRNTLRQWTAHRFDVQPDAPSDERSSDVKRWQTWWNQHRDASPEEWWLERVRNVNQDDPEMASLIDAIRHLADRRSWHAVPELIRLLDHGRFPVRTEALNGLRVIARKRFDRSSDDPGGVAKAVQDQWRNWWTANGENGRVSWLFKRLKTFIDREEQDEEEGNAFERDVMVRELIASDEEDIPASVAPMLLGSRMDREAGIRILRGRTGLTFGYSDDLEEGERNRAVRRWRDWLERWSNQAKLDWMIYELQQNHWTQSRVAVAKYLGTVRNERSVRALLRHGLRDSKEAVREAAFMSLRTLTGRQFDYRADGPWERRNTWRRRWQEWWRKQDQFFAKRGY